MFTRKLLRSWNIWNVIKICSVLGKTWPLHFDTYSDIRDIYHNIFTEPGFSTPAVYSCACFNPYSILVKGMFHLIVNRDCSLLIMNDLIANKYYQLITINILLLLPPSPTIDDLISVTKNISENINKAKQTNTFDSPSPVWCSSSAVKQ